MITQNLHTHTTYCDGKNTIREMVQAAENCGLKTIGFSSHSHCGFSIDKSQIKEKDIDAYFAETAKCKEDFKNKIDIFAGFEYEATHNETGRPVIDRRCDFTIGSVHLLHKNGKTFTVDSSAEEFKTACEYFGGLRNFVEAYYNELVDFSKTTDFTIVGHFDLITKFTEKGIADFTHNRWYGDVSTWALEELIKDGKIFEINTGAMARQYRSTPYPEHRLLNTLIHSKTPLVVSSDAHKAETIDYAFKKTEESLQSLGLKKIEYSNVIKEAWLLS